MTGDLPTKLGNLSNLTWLDLSGNQFTGELPQSLTRLTALEQLYFSNNAGLCAPADEAFQAWRGSIDSARGDNCGLPDSEEDREALVAFYHATDGPNWTNSTNWLSDLPMRAWHGVKTDEKGRVSELSLFGNQLKGDMPAVLGDLSNLTWLSLSSNQLTGGLPTELGKLSKPGKAIPHQQPVDRADASEFDRANDIEEV